MTFCGLVIYRLFQRSYIQVYLVLSSDAELTGLSGNCLMIFFCATDICRDNFMSLDPVQKTHGSLLLIFESLQKPQVMIQDRLGTLPMNSNGVILQITRFKSVFGTALTPTIPKENGKREQQQLYKSLNLLPFHLFRSNQTFIFVTFWKGLN